MQSTDPGLIPRGGMCRSCKTYTLWGDVIRASHRRRMGGTAVVFEDEEPPAEEDDQDDSAATSDTCRTSKGQRKPSKKPLTTPAGKARKAVRANPDDDSEENFDLDAVSGSDEDGPLHTMPVSVKKARPRKQKECAEAPNPDVLITPQISLTYGKGKKKGKGSTITQQRQFTSRAGIPAIAAESEAEGEIFDLNAISSTEEIDDAPPALLAATARKSAKKSNRLVQLHSGNPLKERIPVRKLVSPPNFAQGTFEPVLRRHNLVLKDNEVDFFDLSDEVLPTTLAEIDHRFRTPSPMLMDAEEQSPLFSHLRASKATHMGSSIPTTKAPMQDSPTSSSSSPASSSPRLLRAMSSLSVSSPLAPRVLDVQTVLERHDIIEISDNSDDDAVSLEQSHQITHSPRCTAFKA